jgi:hypothetical protein
VLWNKKEKPPLSRSLSPHSLSSCLFLLHSFSASIFFSHRLFAGLFISDYFSLSSIAASALRFVWFRRRDRINWRDCSHKITNILLHWNDLFSQSRRPTTQNSIHAYTDWYYFSTHYGQYAWRGTIGIYHSFLVRHVIFINGEARRFVEMTTIFEQV